MSLRAGQPGATRICPHCKAIVLESAAVCPGCRHHLRFNTVGKQAGAADGYCALSIDGTIAHRQTGEPCEYCIVLDITNEHGEQLVRQIVGVGALQPGELRRLNLSVDMLPLSLPASKAQTSAPAPPPASAGRPALPGQLPLAARTGAAGAAAAGAAPASSTAGRATSPSSAPRPATPAPPARSPVPPTRAAAPLASPSQAPAAAPPAAGTGPKAPHPGSGGTLGQRLRIFRKP